MTALASNGRFYARIVCIPLTDWVQITAGHHPGRVKAGFDPARDRQLGVAGAAIVHPRLQRALTVEGNVLLLDEPTNDLDVETLSALEEALESFAGCAVVISHDRFFLDRLATHILAFEGDSHVEWFEGNFESYEEDKIARLGDEATRPHRATYKKMTR